MKSFLKLMLKTMSLLFVVFCVFVASLFFRLQHVPGALVEFVLERYLPTNLVVKVESAAFSFNDGVYVNGIRLYDLSMSDPTRLLAGADNIYYHFEDRKIFVKGARYDRLPDSYYAPENVEKNARVEGDFLELGSFYVTLEDADILAVKPRRLTMKVTVSRHRIDFSDMNLLWPDADSNDLRIGGNCDVDLDKQEVCGDIEGVARQVQIRPMLVAIDVPVSLPYMDGFTEIPAPCKSRCTWKVDLVRNDLDLWLDLRPLMGRYNGVPMKWANGKIHLHNYTRGTCLNYTTTIGPIVAKDLKDRDLSGSVVITGTNNYNVVDVKAKSTMPLADLLKIGGFIGDYVGEGVIGESECDLQFRFPRAMTNNYEVLNGHGRITIKNGQLMRMKGFQGMIDAMPSVAPALKWFVDSTQATCEYVIENGVLRTASTYIEGSVFSIKIEGYLDSVKNKMDFKVRVQFSKKDSIVGKILHPIAWPFTKLLLEFRLTGTPEKPEWEYVSVLDRVMEAVK